MSNIAAIMLLQSCTAMPLPVGYDARDDGQNDNTMKQRYMHLLLSPMPMFLLYTASGASEVAHERLAFLKEDDHFGVRHEPGNLTCRVMAGCSPTT